MTSLQILMEQAIELLKNLFNAIDFCLWHPPQAWLVLFDQAKRTMRTLKNLVCSMIAFIQILN
jgi:hypothetical protein